MMKFIEKYSLELFTLLSMIMLLKILLLGFNLIGMYDFNDLFTNGN